MQPHKPLTYSISDAARVSSLGRTRLYELIGEGKLDRVKVGNRTLIKADSLHRLLEIDA
jgi:excisionase family DNA binding protein